jgi:hypothetical protein
MNISSNRSRSKQLYVAKWSHSTLLPDCLACHHPTLGQQGLPLAAAVLVVMQGRCVTSAVTVQLQLAAIRCCSGIIESCIASWHFVVHLSCCMISL